MFSMPGEPDNVVPEKYTLGPQDEGADVTDMKCWIEEGRLLVLRDFEETGRIIEEWPSRLIRSKITKVFRDDRSN